MAKKQINSHDSFFQHLFSKKDEVTEFIEKTTPAEIVSNLRLDTLRLDKTNYVDSKLQKYFADLVYNCDYTFDDNKTKKVKITFLFEHKSHIVYCPYIQLIRYFLNVVETQINQAKNRKEKMRDFLLQPIISIIFYHGAQKWNNQPFENYFDGMDKYLLRFLPKFDYILVDMVNYSNKEIERVFKEKQLQVGLLLMKNIFYEDKLLDVLKKILTQLINFSDKNQEDQFYETIASYIYYSSNVNFNKFSEIMETLAPQKSKTFISLADQFKILGEKRGIEKGIKKVAHNLILNGFDNHLIMKTTGLDEEQINYLRTLGHNNINMT